MFSLKKILNIAIITTTLSLAGCANMPLQPEAQNVVISLEPAAASCEYRGEVQTDQGDFYTGILTPASMLEKNASNDLRNQAMALGANYIDIIQSATKKPLTLGTGGPNIAYHIQGNAYHCPKLPKKMF